MSEELIGQKKYWAGEMVSPVAARRLLVGKFEGGDLANPQLSHVMVCDLMQKQSGNQIQNHWLFISDPVFFSPSSSHVNTISFFNMKILDSDIDSEFIGQYEKMQEDLRVKKSGLIRPNQAPIMPK